MKTALRPLGPVTTRMMKLRKLEVSIANGSDPDVIELEDCTEVYGDDFPPTDSTCTKSHSGQHIYSRDYFDWRRCTCCHEWDE